MQVLSYHVVPSGAVRSSQFVSGQSVNTALAGASITVTRLSSGALRIKGGSGCAAKVVASNIRAGRSVIHVIDSVLLPP